MEAQNFLDYLVALNQITTSQASNCIEQSKTQGKPVQEVLLSTFSQKEIQELYLEYENSLQNTLIVKQQPTLTESHFAGEKPPLSPTLPHLKKNDKPASASSATPLYFGNYRVLEKIAEGGMGAVYKAQDSQRKIYAIKVILAGPSATKPLIDRFHREFKNNAKLQHPNIVRVLESGEEQGQHFFVMEYVEGATLEDKIKEGLPWKTSLILFQKILKALHYAHREGIIHRDLKPSNIFITQEGEPKIGDFGLAKDLSHSPSQQLTRSGEIMGTPAYMAPEQISLSEESTFDPQLDVYAMAVCLYSMLTQSCPFEGSTIHELFYKILSEEPVPPSRKNPEIPVQLDLIVLKGLQKSKAKRYKNASLFAKDLERFMKGMRVFVKLKTPQERFQQWLKKYRHAVTVGLITIFIFICFSSYQWWSKRSERLLRFEEHWERAKAKKQEAQNIQNRSQKIQTLLNALQEINRALLEVPEEKRVEKFKMKISGTLIAVACKQKEFELAEHIVHQMEGLRTVSPASQKKLLREVQQAREKTREQYLYELSQILNDLRKKGISSAQERENLIFRVSDMKDKKVLQHLLETLKEGEEYFSKSKRSVRMDEFYTTIATMIGRLGLEEAYDPLRVILQKRFRKNKIKKPKQRSVAELQFMSQLFHSLVYLFPKTNQKLPQLLELEAIRWGMGQHQFFWENTQSTYQQLLVRINLGGFRPRTSKEYQLRAEILESQGNLKGALADYHHVLEKDPKTKRIHLRIGLICHKEKQYKTAIQHYTLALEGLQKKHAIASAYHNRSLAKYASGDLTGAIQDCSQVLQIQPDYAEAYNNRARFKIAQKRFKEAFQDYQKALQIDPQNAQTWANLALLQMRLGKTEEAFIYFKRAIALQPKQAFSYRNRGQLYLQKGKYTNALRDLNKAIYLDPKNPEAYLLRAQLKFEQKNFSEALPDIAEALYLNPKSFRAYHLKGQIALAKQEYTKARESFQQAIQRNPQYLEAYHNHGITFENLKRPVEALQNYNKALQLDPDYLPSLHRRAYLLGERGEYQAALEDCNQILKQAQNDSRTYFRRGMLYQALNKPEKAKQDFAAFLARTQGSSDPDIRRSHSWILQQFPELKNP